MANVENGALQSAIDNAAVGEIVVLTSDITLTSRVTVSNVVVIDLNGYTIRSNVNDDYGAIYVGTKGILTIKDSSSEQTGEIINTDGNAIGNYGIVHIYGGIFVGKYALFNFYYSDTIYGTSTIYGGVFKSVDGDAIAVANSGNLTINGGAIESIHTTNVLTITDGTIEHLYIGVSDYNPVNQNTFIKGGHIVEFTVDDNSTNNVVASGGTFDFAIDNKYLADGVKLTYNANTGTYVANVNQVVKVIATSSSRIKDLVIKNGQVIFIQDTETIAFDWKGKRKLYNQIVELDTDYDRENLSDPVNRKYYFVIGTGVLWRYFNGWTQITSKPDEVVCIGIELPELGKENVLYVQKEEREILVWDAETGEYIAVANYTGTMSADDVSTLFHL